MTPQERDLLEGFLGNLAQAPAPSIDSEADTVIRRAFSTRPHAPYVLVQQALLQQIALQEAQAQIDDLQRQLREARREGAAPVASFLGGGLASGAHAQSAGSAARDWSGPGVSNAQSPPLHAATRSGWSDFLRSAASTATGVAGGALLFQGLESLLGRHAGIGSGSLFGGGTPEIVENTTIINEPDSGPSPDDASLDNLAEASSSLPEADAEDADLDQGDWDDSSFDDPSDDSSWT